MFCQGFSDRIFFAYLEPKDAVCFEAKITMNEQLNRQKCIEFLG